MLHSQPAAHGRELLLGEGHLRAASLSLNLDEQPIVRAPQFGAGLRLDLDEAGFGASGNLGTSTITRNRPTGARQAADLSAVIPGI
jgi:hypothetical protein